MVKRNLKRIVIILVGLYVMIGSSLYLLQEKIVFRPTVLNQDYKFEFNHEFEELFLKPEKDVAINALHFKAKNPKGVMIYFHGNAGDLSRWGILAEYFVEQHYDVFIIDYRTYGKSTGVLSEEALFSDAQFAYNYVLKSYDESQITVYGRSLGTGIATYIASKNHPKQLILETPYFNLLDVAKHRFPIFPVKYLLRYKLESNKYIKQVSCPIAIFHGTNDYIVPFSSGEKLFKNAPKQQASFIKIEEGRHNDLINFEAYQQGIQKLLE